MRIRFSFGLPVLLLISGCSYDNGNVHRVYPSGSSGSTCPSPTTPAESTIDTGRTLEVDPGQGAGVFVEYATDGHWQLRTSCDTLKTSSNCRWDVIVTPEDGSSIVNVVGTDLEPGDEVIPYPQDAVSYQLTASTGSDIDGFSFDSNPGAAVLVDAYLDEHCALSYFYWVGDGALHSGSPTNPLVLIPSAN
ncbi:MAG: hypothetical protein ABUL62_10310 [Myxococcales bacterium]